MKEPDFSIFYSLEYINLHRQLASNHYQWGSIISSEDNEFPIEYQQKLEKNVIYKPVRSKYF